MTTAGSEATIYGAVAIIVAQVIILFQNRRQTKKVETVQQTLTEPNGGSHVKDQLNRIEVHLERADMRMDRLERFGYRLENKFNSHIEWSNAIVDQQDDRLTSLEGKRSG